MSNAQRSRSPYTGPFLTYVSYHVSNRKFFFVLSREGTTIWYRWSRGYARYTIITFIIRVICIVRFTLLTSSLHNVVLYTKVHLYSSILFNTGDRALFYICPGCSDHRLPFWMTHASVFFSPIPPHLFDSMCRSFT